MKKIFSFMVAATLMFAVACTEKEETTVPEPETHPTETTTLVDLGLPSGTLWASNNLGAASDTETGDYFYWGYVPSFDTFTQAYYMQVTDNSVHGNIAGTQHDPATQRLGAEYHTPTVVQWQELIDECTWTRTDKGYEVTSVSDPEAKIFLPYTYSADNRGILSPSNYADHKWGCYWSSEEDEENNVKANYLYFNQYGDLQMNNPMYGTAEKWGGMTIRPVK